ncbi:MAG: hypothetical protein QW829_00825 [Candidatus Bathyarchaeia archaeon]
MVRILIKILYPEFFKLSKDTWILEQECEEIDIKRILQNISNEQEGSNLSKFLQSEKENFILVLIGNTIYNTHQKIKPNCQDGQLELTLIPLFEGGSGVN